MTGSRVPPGSLAVLVCALVGASLGAAQARDSIFTAHGSGPLYWSIYGWNYDHYVADLDPVTPESVWTKNVGWVEATFESAGYDMVATDGWLLGPTPVTRDGFMMTYGLWNPLHDWPYWARQYLAPKQLKLGVYYNPLWITQAAYDQDNLISDTGISVRQITGKLENFDGTVSDARCPSGSNCFYWVDVNRAGAREWVQGYVNYFRLASVAYLRMDFLADFENAYGQVAYETALGWIKDAAGDSIFLSLVVPNCFDGCKRELKYGDMIRVSADTLDGGWHALSDRCCDSLWPCNHAERRRCHSARPVRRHWPQFDNVWDGFTYFSRIAGRNRLILDGDFLRLASFVDDTERRSAISLYVMAGSPLAIADYCTDEGCPPVDPGSGLGPYRNSEVLALNELGLVGHPLDSDGPKGRIAPDSERWVGKLPGGAWVVGLFNRSATTSRVKRISYRAHLGIRGKASTRDLWAHAELGPMGSYRVKLAPHESRLLKITPDATGARAAIR